MSVTNHDTTTTQSTGSLVVCSSRGSARTISSAGRVTTVLTSFNGESVHSIAKRARREHGGRVMLGRDRDDSELLAAEFQYLGCTVDRVDEFALAWAALLP